MKKILTISLFFVSCFLYSQDDKYLPSIHSGTVIHHKNYVLSYVEKYEGAEWVAYELTYPETKNNVERKNGKFMDDDSVKTRSATHSDYTNSGYDRGHLAPAGDMNFDLDAMLESFYMSNVLPQAPELNRKTWKYLEDDIRYYVMRHKTPLYIVTGGIFFKNDTCIGKNKVKVPSNFYKIIYDERTGRSLAFIVPNKNTLEQIGYYYYVSSIDEIEFFTDIDFVFPITDEAKVEENWLK